MDLSRRKPDKSNIHSLEVALTILTKMARHGKPVTLKELSELCHEPPSKVHRYLATLLSMDFVTQSQRHGSYGLGRGCIYLGLAAIRQVDLFQRVESSLAKVAKDTGCHTFLSIWTTGGPIIIRWVFSDDPVTVNTLPGQLISVSRSSSGRVFAAFLPRSQTEPILERELASFGDDSDYAKSIREKISEVQRNRYAISRGELESHLKSISVPILDWHDNLMVVAGCTMDVNADQERMQHAMRILTAFAEEKSLRPAESAFDFQLN